MTLLIREFLKVIHEVLKNLYDFEIFEIGLDRKWVFYDKNIWKLSKNKISKIVIQCFT